MLHLKFMILCHAQSDKKLRIKPLGQELMKSKIHPNIKSMRTYNQASEN